MKLGKDCYNIITREIANTFFRNNGIIVGAKVSGDIIDTIGEMIWEETEILNMSQLEI